MNQVLDLVQAVTQVHAVEQEVGQRVLAKMSDIVIRLLVPA